MNKIEFSRGQRLRFVAKLTKLIAPSGSASTLQALNDAVFPGLADLSDAAFGAHMPALIATRCTSLPDTDELRTLLTEALKRTASDERASRAPNGKAPTPILDWLYAKIMANCGGHPGPLLREWIQIHGRDVIEPDPIPVGRWEGPWEHGMPEL